MHYDSTWVTGGDLLPQQSDADTLLFVIHSGERRRKSVRGCIVSSDVSVLNLVIVKKGEQVQGSACLTCFAAGSRAGSW